MSKTIKILHGGDIHLDTPFESLPEEKAVSRRKMQRTLLREIASLARSEQVDLVLLAGDLLDGSTAYMETLRDLTRMFSGIDVPIFISPGNHDYYAPDTPYGTLALPDNVHVFKSSEIECRPLPELGVRVWGAGFTDRVSPPLLEGFKVSEGPPGIIDLLVIHGEVTPVSMYNPISEMDLEESGVHYAALGHSHYFSGLRRAGGTYYAWPGCAEGRGFDETGDKGVIIAQVSRDDVKLRLVPLPGAMRYEILEVSLTDKADVLKAVLSELPGDCTRCIYRIIFTGQAIAPPDMRKLRRELEDRFFALEMEDKTTPPTDVWDGMGADSLRGLFANKLYNMLKAAKSEDEKSLILEAARWGQMALDNVDEA